MADMTLCTGDGCTMRDKCKRYRTHQVESADQSYMNPPYEFFEDECWYYIPE